MGSHEQASGVESDRRRVYQAYLLRCWAEPHGENIVWRFSLEAVSNPARYGFAGLTELLQFLKGELDGPSNADRNAEPK